MTDLMLLNLIYTRISHDLSNLAGALYNGTELLAEDPLGVKETSALLTQSSTALMYRLQFFRQTFGMPIESTEDKTAQYLSTLSVSIEWKDCCENALERAIVMVLADQLTRGGKIIKNEQTFHAIGEKLKENTYLSERLIGNEKNATPEDAPALMAAHLAATLGKKLTLQQDQQELRIKIENL